MTLISFLMLLLIAGICGTIGQAIAGSGRGGILVLIASSARYWECGWLARSVCVRCLPSISADRLFRSSGRSSARRCSSR